MSSRIGMLFLVFSVTSTLCAQEASDLHGELWGRAPKVERKKVLEMIGERVERILALQQEDGSFPLFAKTINGYTLGQTALAVTALQYARPHLEGDLRKRADEAVAKGVKFIAQKKPEALTYSVGLILGVLQREDATTYRALIDAYARLLVQGQITDGRSAGMWGYKLGSAGRPVERGPGDNSNTQFAVLGLHAATRAGYQVPQAVWARLREHYLATQSADGAWGYRPGEPGVTANMTVAGTVSLQIAEDMVRQASGSRLQAPGTAEEDGKGKDPGDEAKEEERARRAVAKGLKWLETHWIDRKVGSETYGLYALERLGILMGRANLGRIDWYGEGVHRLFAGEWRANLGTPDVASCFGVMFLSAGLDPVVINKLQLDEAGPDPYRWDVRHLVEHLQDTRGERIQWRIVTPEAPIELLKQTPILYLSGSGRLGFSPGETDKMKDYVRSGGTILAVRTGEGRAFDESLRTWVHDNFGRDLQRIDADHPLYDLMKTDKLSPTPEVWLLATDDEDVRPLVIYLPHDVARLWHLGGSRAAEAFAIGAGVYRYATGKVTAER